MAHKTAVLYARYSSDKQREASIDDQLRVCRDYCKAEGIDVVAEYKDYALSGKTDHRPEFRRMIANAPESDYVVVYMFDRFSRDRYDSATYKKTLRECGVRVLSASEKVEDTPEGGLQEGMPELLSEYYVRDLARKVRRGMEGNALKAKDNGYRIFGYSTDPETRCYVIDEAEANAVREMFSMHISGNSVNSIAREMARRGWTTTTGKLFCGFCGKPMHGTAGTGKKGKRYHYYACKEGDGCKRPWVRRELLEDSIADAVLETCSDERRMRMLARRIVEAYVEPGEEEAEMASIEAQIVSLEREQHNMTQAAMKGFVTDEMVARNDEIKA